MLFEVQAKWVLRVPTQFELRCFSFSEKFISCSAQQQSGFFVHLYTKEENAHFQYISYRAILQFPFYNKYVFTFSSLLYNWSFIVFTNMESLKTSKRACNKPDSQSEPNCVGFRRTHFTCTSNNVGPVGDLMIECLIKRRYYPFTFKIPWNEVY